MRNKVILTKMLNSNRFKFMVKESITKETLVKTDYVKVICEDFNVNLFTYIDDPYKTKFAVITSDDHHINALIHSILSKIHLKLQIFTNYNDSIKTPISVVKGNVFAKNLYKELKGKQNILKKT